MVGCQSPAWAPSSFGASPFGRWVPAHSLVDFDFLTKIHWFHLLPFFHNFMHFRHLSKVLFVLTQPVRTKTHQQKCSTPAIRVPRKAPTKSLLKLKLPNIASAIKRQLNYENLFLTSNSQTFLIHFHLSSGHAGDHRVKWESENGKSTKWNLA